MRFTSHEQRMQHPQARLIPQPLWQELFHYVLPDKLIRLMIEAGEENLIVSLGQMPNLATDYEKKQFWLGIVLSHPHLNEDMLVLLAKKLRMDGGTLHEAAAIWGSLEFFKSLGSSNPLRYGGYKLFKHAAQYGHLPILEYLEDKAPEQLHTMIAANSYYAFRTAAGQGHLPILNYLEGKASDQLHAMIAANDYYAFRTAAGQGHLPVLEYLEGKAPDQLHAMIAANNYSAFYRAAAEGYLPVLNYLERKASNQLHTMIAADNYFAFCGAAEQGHLPVLEYLEGKAPEQLHAMIAADNYSAFRKAAEGGHLSILNYLERKAPNRLHAMSAVDNYFAFRKAAEGGHLPVLNYLERKAPGQLHAMIAAGHYSAFRLAAANGYLSVLEYLEDKAPDQLHAMVVANDYDAFLWAAGQGYLPILNYLESKAPDQLHAMIAASNYSAFSDAAANGHLPVLNYLEGKAPDQLHAMIAADSYAAFHWAAAKGHLPVLEYLEDKASEQLPEMITADNYSAFRQAAAKGHLPVLEYLESKAPEQLHAMIAADNYFAFRETAKLVNLHVLEYLESKAPEQLHMMIAADNYSVFCEAAAEGHLSVLEYLGDKVPNQLHAMIAAGHYSAFREAAAEGHLSILEYLEDKAPNQLHAMIAAEHYSAFYRAAANGHLFVLEYLAGKAPSQLHAMIAANHYSAFRGAYSNNHKNVVNYLLSESSDLFAYLEEHEHEYSLVVNCFVTAKLETLHRQKTTAVQEEPPFDVPPKEAKLLFYAVRRLIRQNNPAACTNLLFLLQIPGIKALVHTDVTPDRPNELLRLALTRNNPEAVRQLMTIPAVAELAAAHDYYRDELQNGMDLRQLARDKESSLKALSPGELQRLEDVCTHYQPLLEERGVDQVIDDLRQTLKQRYAQQPATIRIEATSRPLVLPLTWEDFHALKLASEDRTQALIAYYRHKDHTAWRYLSKPNPWMHQNASYVYVNPDNPNERWSSFEGYQSELGLFFLAVNDNTIPATEGHTQESRLAHFIDELAHIGRAHNWDKTRTRITDTGEIGEEYDDLEADKPSCYSGVKRRLFQSVQGHPFFNLVTKELIQQELDSFVREHLKQLIHEHNTPQLKSICQKQLEAEALNEEEQQLLQQFDIGPEQQDKFILSLSKKYGAQFTKDPEFEKEIKSRLRLKEHERHALNFYYLNWHQYLQSPETEQQLSEKSSNSALSTGFFHAQTDSSNAVGAIEHKRRKLNGLD